jgi:hypothetical protein
MEYEQVDQMKDGDGFNFFFDNRSKYVEQHESLEQKWIVIAIFATLHASFFDGLPFPSTDSNPPFFSFQIKKFKILYIYTGYN